jgi:hypothetical protein
MAHARQPPPPSSVRARVQVGVGAFFFVGEQIFAAVGKRPPSILEQMHENKLMTAAAVYGLDAVAQTLKSINAFEVTYNGHVLYSKLATGTFPELSALVEKLRATMEKEQAAAR